MSAKGEPFHVGILGDFSGRSNRGISEPIAKSPPRRFVSIDRDNFEEVLTQLGVELILPIGPSGAPLTLRFRTLEDFHPDRIFNEVVLFEKLRQTRRRLNNNATFEEAAEEIRNWQGSPASSAPAAAKPAGPAAPITGNVLDAILGEGASPEAAVAKPRSDAMVDWNDLVKDIVRPYVVAAPDARQPALVKLVDEAVAAQMRVILHHPEFQALESNWRSLDFLVKLAETDGNLKLYLLDVSKDELRADLVSDGELGKTGAYRWLIEQKIEVPSGIPWAILLGAYSFSKTAEDATLLSRIGQIAAKSTAPFIAGADGTVVGCTNPWDTPDPDDWEVKADNATRGAWDALRSSAQSQYLMLAWPRVLQRLPYGKKTEPCEQFAFEEVVGNEKPPHDTYLWGNPAFFAVSLLTQAFTEHGWSFSRGVQRIIEGLPVHIVMDDGDQVMRPCGEMILMERASERVNDEGVTPVLSYRDRDAIQIGGFASLSKPSGRLVGRWS